MALPGEGYQRVQLDHLYTCYCCPALPCYQVQGSVEGGIVLSDGRRLWSGGRCERITYPAR
jgi:hypothetical protein